MIFHGSSIYVIILMDESELKELYKLIKRSYDESCWKTLNDALDYISEFIEVDEESNTEND